jgi:hypothetical protein
MRRRQQARLVADVSLPDAVVTCRTVAIGQRDAQIMMQRSDA